MPKRPLRIAFLHPDLGIGGAERLVVDAALGLQSLGHTVDIYTSHWDSQHCFEETKNGCLNVRYIKPPFPRSIGGKLHILCAHARQLHLTTQLILRQGPPYDVYFVDQLSTCVPFLRAIGKTRVVFYCHFPDKLLANRTFLAGGNLVKAQGNLLKRIYRYPMDLLEEMTTRQADVILANSKFTAHVFRSHFPSIQSDPDVVYPGINIQAYTTQVDLTDPEITKISSSRPTLLSLNRFEKKKNAALAIESFARLKKLPSLDGLRLVLAGGYDPRLQDNTETLDSLVELSRSHSLTYTLEAPDKSIVSMPIHTRSHSPDILFLLNFTTVQRTALLNSPSTKVLIYTPANEHFGIGPVEAMVCGVPILACDSGGPTESVIDDSTGLRTGWLRPPDPEVWAETLREILGLQPHDRESLSSRGKQRAREMFSLDAMSERIEEALLKAVSMGKVNGPNVIYLAGLLVVLTSILLSFLFW